MKILDLPLKAKWYDMIEIGEKKEEYREIKDYWIKRLTKCKGENVFEKTGFFCKKANCRRCLVECDGFHAEEYTHVRFRYGYTQRTMLFKIDNISIGHGISNWGAEEGVYYFVIKLGEEL